MCTTAGPPTHSTLPPSALTSRICWAIWRSSSDCGFSLDTADDMNSKVSVLWSRCGSTTFTPLGAADDLVAGLDVRDGHGADAARPSTSRPQSISGCSTGTQDAPSRTTVSRLVVE